MAQEREQAFYLDVAERLVKQLEAGTSPFQMPYDLGFRLPYNPVTDARYRGINVASLLGEGRSDPRWMTFNQAKAQGYQVRKGEKGAMVQFWSFTQRVKAADEAGREQKDEQGKAVYEEVRRRNPLCRLYYVFNAEQMDGVPALEARSPIPDIERAETLLSASGAVIEHGHDMAAYLPNQDRIILPEREAFHSAAHYYATALHELGHWTGHENRLDRDIRNPFGSELYAKEKLRAEIASLMLSDELGIGSDFENHAAYVQSWITVLKNEPEFLVTACRDANKINDYVLELEKGRDLAMEANRMKETWTWNKTEIKQEFGNALREAGLRIEGDPIMDGQLRRVAVERDDKPHNQDGAYVGYLDGHPAGYFKNHYTGIEDRWKAKGYFLSREQAAETRAVSAARQAARRTEREALYKRSARALEQRIAQQAKAPVQHPYFVAKNVFIPGLTLDERNNLVVPVRDMQGRLMSAALVNKGWKGIVPDTQLRGGFFMLGELPSKGYRGDIAILEGVATGATVHRATGMPVAVAFVNTNLENVAAEFRQAYPGAQRWVLGDDDAHKTINSGRQYAEKAAQATDAGVIFPRFLQGQKGSEFSDFNDLAREHGDAVVRQQIKDGIQQHHDRLQTLDTHSRSLVDRPVLDRLFNNDGETIEVRLGAEVGDGLRVFQVINKTSLEQQQLIGNEQVIRSAAKQYGVRVDDNHDLDKRHPPQAALGR